MSMAIFAYVYVSIYTRECLYIFMYVNVYICIYKNIYTGKPLLAL